MRISQDIGGAIFSSSTAGLLLFLATDEACLPSAVRTEFGKCAIVRFLFVAETPPS